MGFSWDFGRNEFGEQDNHGRDWLYWYDEQKNRYPAPEEILRQERGLREQEQILREREQLIRRELEEQLEQGRIQREVEVRSREAEQALRLKTELTFETKARSCLNAERAVAQEKQTIALNLLKQGIEMETIAQATGLTISELEGFANAQLRRLQVGDY